MIEVGPYDDGLALAVLRHLDPHDQIEAEIVRGAAATGHQLWADWRAAQPYRVQSFVARTDAKRGHVPFAVFGLSHTGQAGVAQAALLARDHVRFRRPLARLAGMIRAQMPERLGALGIHRIEARSWALHPTAAGLLRSLGFVHEVDMPGFGLTGCHIYSQFAWVFPDCAASKSTACQDPLEKEA